MDTTLKAVVIAACIFLSGAVGYIAIRQMPHEKTAQEGIDETIARITAEHSGPFRVQLY